MSIEQPGENIIDLAAARKKREAKREERVLETGDFLVILGGYQKKFELINKDLEKLLDDPNEDDTNKVFIQRQIEMNKQESIRLLFAMSQYRSYEEQLQKIERLLEIFHMIDGETKKRANRSLQALSVQLEDLRKVFVDYGLQEEAEKVELLKEKILQGFVMSAQYVDQEDMSRNVLQTENEGASTADVQLFDSLVYEMNAKEEYDLFLVAKVKGTIEAFTHYASTFRIYNALEKVEQYQKMCNDLESALARYERRDA